MKQQNISMHTDLQLPNNYLLTGSNNLKNVILILIRPWIRKKREKAPFKHSWNDSKSFCLQIEHVESL